MHSLIEVIQIMTSLKNAIAFYMAMCQAKIKIFFKKFQKSLLEEN